MNPRHRDSLRNDKWGFIAQAQGSATSGHCTGVKKNLDALAPWNTVVSGNAGIRKSTEEPASSGQQKTTMYTQTQEERRRETLHAHVSEGGWVPLPSAAGGSQQTLVVGLSGTT